MIRRSFLRGLGFLGLAGPVGLAGATVGLAVARDGGHGGRVSERGEGEGEARGEGRSEGESRCAPADAGGVASVLRLEPAEERAYWVDTMTRVATPVLENLVAGRLRERMPVEVRPGVAREDRARYSHLEALGRTLAGLAPWLELGPDPTPEGEARTRMLALTHQALATAVDPDSPDFMNFTEGGQPLVDAAFLAHAIVRAPGALWDDVDAVTRRRVVDALVATRAITPYYSNWLLFSTMVEAALLRAGEAWDPVRLDLTLRKVSEWYLGDGVYGDGPELRFDYYNSFVIQPFLLDTLRLAREPVPALDALYQRHLHIARRHGEILERMVAPDGSFPPVGRSLTYRCGAFQHLAQLALQGLLPEALPPAQVRSALGAVIRRTLEPTGTFDDAGWLRLGLAGAQPGLAEWYISTGSLYLCTTAFLPLGLPPADPFWSGPPAPWTAVRAWNGEPVQADRALQLPA